MKRHVALCFDDALAPQAELIRELGVPVTLPVPTSWVGQAGHLSWDQIQRLASDGHEIACHAHDHAAWQRAGSYDRNAGHDFDPQADLETAMSRFDAQGFKPAGFVPPANLWLDDCARQIFSYGRRGQCGANELLPEVHRMPAKGLSRLAPEDLPAAAAHQRERPWAIYVAHLYASTAVAEAALIRRLVRRLSDEGAQFVTLGQVAERFAQEVDLSMERCTICSRSDLLDYRGRTRVRCPGCGRLERHRSVAYLLEHGDLLLPKPNRACTIASQELVAPLEALGWSIAQVSPFVPPPLNDAQAIGLDTDSIDLVALQHVLPHVEDDRKVLSEVRRILRPGGVALIEHPLNGKATREVDRDGQFRSYGRDDWEALVRGYLTIRDRLHLMPEGILYVLERSE